MGAVLSSLDLPFRHLQMPAGIPLLDVLLVVYMLWRAGDERGRLSSIGSGILTLEFCDAILQAENPAIAASADCLLTVAAVLPELRLHTVCKDDPLTVCCNNIGSPPRISP